MSTCIKCGQDAGFFKEVCSDCSDTAPEDSDPAPTDAQQDDDEQRPQAKNSGHIDNWTDAVDEQHRVDPVSNKKAITAFWLVLSQIGAIAGAFVVAFSALFDSRNAIDTLEGYVALTLICSFVSWILFAHHEYKWASLLSSMPLLVEVVGFLKPFFRNL
jgi:hypothetical protein